eukprot:scaffold17929_cov142-Skeletonema_dohrnii-CCMP3373.AAC.5
MPTWKPLMKPTQYPSHRPTPRPTPLPTPMPTPRPTPRPTPLPTPRPPPTTTTTSTTTTTTSTTTTAAPPPTTTTTSTTTTTAPPPPPTTTTTTTTTTTSTTKVPCDDLEPFPVEPNTDNKCGSEGQGGSECKLQCCAAQKEYCLRQCSFTPDPNGCLLQCLKDRGCDFDTSGVTCNDLEPFLPGIIVINKCGSEGQGGAKCELQCCAAQKIRCLNACENKDRFEKNDCLFNCLANRGCDYGTSGVICDDLSPFPTKPVNNIEKKCGTPAQGGARCKSDCCAEVNVHCRDPLTCVLLPCSLQCLIDRDCP